MPLFPNKIYLLMHLTQTLRIYNEYTLYRTVRLEFAQGPDKRCVLPRKCLRFTVINENPAINENYTFAHVSHALSILY